MRQGHELFPLGRLQVAVASHALRLHRVGAFLVPCRHDHLAQLVLLGHRNRLFHRQAGLLGLLLLLRLDALGLGVLAGLHRLDLSLLLGLHLGKLPVELQDGFLGLHVLPRNGLVLLALAAVGQLELLSREHRDLLDALGVEDVVGVEQLLVGLLQEVDGRVLEQVAVEVRPDDLEDLLLELDALGVEVGEVESLADRLEGFGELGVEELHQGPGVAGPRSPATARRA